MRIIVILGILLLSFSNGFTQQEKAKKILDELGKKIQSYNSFYIKFSSKIVNTDAGINENNSGEAWVKGEKYFASMGKNTIISNGIKNWMISAKDKSVYITAADNEDSDMMNPKKLMTIWEKDVRYRFVKTENGTHIIHLHPRRPRSMDFHTIVLKISESKKELKNVEVSMNDGTKMTYDISTFTPNVSVDDSKFVYDSKNYPGYEEIED
jgi:outer membrane lipoprotein-sorting protein